MDNTGLSLLRIEQRNKEGHKSPAFQGGGFMSSIQLLVCPAIGGVSPDLSSA